MPLGTLQSFIQNFQQSRDWQQQQQDRAQKQHALAALGRALSLPDPAPGAPQQAGPSAPAVPHQALAAMAGGGGPAPAAGPAPGAPPPAGPSPAPAPSAPQPRPLDPNLSGTAQNQGGGPMDAMQEAQQNIKAMAMSIKQANPGIDPATLLMAVEQQIENVKGVAPLTKATMTAQVATLKMQQDFAYKQSRLKQLDEKLQIDWKNAKTKEAQAAAMKEYHDGLLALGEDRIESQEKIAAGHDSTRLEATDRTQAGANAREGMRDQNRLDVADTQGEHSDYRADQGYRGAQARSGSKADAAPRRPQSRQSQRLRGDAPPVPGAKKAPDGHWYVKQGGQFLRVDG